jgi:hypothetical protein
MGEPTLLRLATAPEAAQTRRSTGFKACRSGGLIPGKQCTNLVNNSW